MAELSFGAGEIIFKVGDQSECAYTVVAGRVEILEGEPPTRVAVIRAGQIFGEMGLVDERPRTLTARAVDEVQLITVNLDELVDLLMYRPEESLRFLRSLFERLRSLNAPAAPATPRPAQAPAVIISTVTLFPMTAPAATTLPAAGLRLTRLPFRIGRAPEKGEANRLGVNDLSLPDMLPFNVSRNHFSIENRRDHVIVRDRGSFLGTIVNGVQIGGRHHVGTADLRLGDNEITVGSAESPFRIRATVERSTTGDPR